MSTAADRPRRMLVNPGPTNVSEQVRVLLLAPDMSHRAPEFRAALGRVQASVLSLLGGTETHACVLFAASGTGANEAVISSIHGSVLTLVGGRYGERLAAIVDRYGIPQRRLVSDRFAPVDPAAVRAALADDPAVTHIVMAHHETTTGVVAPLRAIGELADEWGKKLVVDGISSVGAHPFDLRDDHVTFLTLNSNKCLESVPGVSLVLARRDELATLEGASRSFYFDLHAQWSRGEKVEVPYTMPVQVVLALDEALRRFEAEGYDARVRRYAAMAATMRAGLEELGFELAPIPSDARANVVTTARMPEGMDFDAVAACLADRGIEAYTASELLADRYCYFATLGAIDVDDVRWFLARLGEAVTEIVTEAGPTPSAAARGLPCAE